MRSVLRRVLLCIGLPIMITHGAYHAVGCASALKALDEYDSPQDNADLKRCRNEGRAAKEAGADKFQAFDAYEACTRDAGLR